MNEEVKKTESWQHESWVSILGMLAWIVGIASGAIEIIVGLVGLPLVAFGWGYPIWYIISGIIAIVISFLIILPKFSTKCSKKDWDALYNWTVTLGNIRFPWMLIWGVIMGIFGWGWGSAFILIPAFVLLFAGPKPYEWKT
ncbi:MAG: hypothetical protein R3255_02890 [Candidatus Lokiarchaeia archaeon]|nr:hypothetical protein [Candidatus Lokiarchaeia archaeon]